MELSFIMKEKTVGGAGVAGVCRSGVLCWNCSL